MKKTCILCNESFETQNAQKVCETCIKQNARENESRANTLSRISQKIKRNKARIQLEREEHEETNEETNGVLDLIKALIEDQKAFKKAVFERLAALESKTKPVLVAFEKHQDQIDRKAREEKESRLRELNEARREAFGINTH